MPQPQLPEVRRLPQGPMMPGQLPHFPDMDDGDEELPEIVDKGDPATKKAPEKPTPEIEKPFVPDLDKTSRKEIEKKIKKIIKEDKPGKKRPGRDKEKDRTVH